MPHSNPALQSTDAACYGTLLSGDLLVYIIMFCLTEVDLISEGTKWTSERTSGCYCYAVLIDLSQLPFTEVYASGCC